MNIIIILVQVYAYMYMVLFCAYGWDTKERTSRKNKDDAYFPLPFSDSYVIYSTIHSIYHFILSSFECTAVTMWSKLCCCIILLSISVKLSNTNTYICSSHHQLVFMNRMKISLLYLIYFVSTITIIIHCRSHSPKYVYLTSCILHNSI